MIEELSLATQRRVFVVDDEAAIATTLALILQSKGFDATSFTNPETALATSRTFVPDLLISDVAMPELSGVELAIRMKELHPACKVLLFSGQAATADLLDEARKQGHAFTLLTKPVHPSDLLSRINSVFDKQTSAPSASRNV